MKKRNKTKTNKTKHKKKTNKQTNKFRFCQIVFLGNILKREQGWSLSNNKKMSIWKSVCLDSYFWLWTLRGFNILFCACRIRFCTVPSWRQPLFGIRFYCVFFIRYWKIESKCPSVLVPTYHVRFLFIVYCVTYKSFIDNYRNHEYTNSVPYVSQQRGRTRFSKGCRG